MLCMDGLPHAWTCSIADKIRFQTAKSCNPRYGSGPLRPFLGHVSFFLLVSKIGTIFIGSTRIGRNTNGIGPSTVFRLTKPP